MNLYVEHDAATIAALASIQAPGCDGVIVKLGQIDEVLASTVRSNPLGGQWLLDVDSPGKRIVAWSGTLSDELFAANPMTWLSPGHTALSAFCDELSPQLSSHGMTMCFHPHARHVLNDPQSCLNFIRDREDQPFNVALAPASLLEVSMIDRIEDHLIRAFETLGDRCSMVMLSDAAVHNDDEPSLLPVPLGEGVLPREVVLELIEQYVPPDTPIVLQPQRLDEQLKWLSPLARV